jgi:hypothetical protein
MVGMPVGKRRNGCDCRERREGAQPSTGCSRGWRIGKNRAAIRLNAGRCTRKWPNSDAPHDRDYWCASARERRRHWQSGGLNPTFRHQRSATRNACIDNRRGRDPVTGPIHAPPRVWLVGLPIINAAAARQVWFRCVTPDKCVAAQKQRVALLGVAAKGTFKEKGQSSGVGAGCQSFVRRIITPRLASDDGPACLLRDGRKESCSRL